MFKKFLFLFLFIFTFSFSNIFATIEYDSAEFDFIELREKIVEFDSYSEPFINSYLNIVGGTRRNSTVWYSFVFSRNELGIVTTGTSNYPFKDSTMVGNDYMLVICYFYLDSDDYEISSVGYFNSTDYEDGTISGLYGVKYSNYNFPIYLQQSSLEPNYTMVGTNDPFIPVVPDSDSDDDNDFDGLFGSLWENIHNFFTGLFDSIFDFFENIFTFFDRLFNPFSEHIEDFEKTSLEEIFIEKFLIISQFDDLFNYLNVSTQYFDFKMNLFGKEVTVITTEFFEPYVPSFRQLIKVVLYFMLLASIWNSLSSIFGMSNKTDATSSS